MSDLPEAIAEIISLNGGSLIGKTRLQKTAYLLESAGLGFGFEFDYHYYGPYSEEVSIAANDAEALDLIKSTQHVSQYGFEYVTFSSNNSPRLGNADLRKRRIEVISLLKGYDAVTLELAATADFLSKNGYEDEPWAETRRRKASKASSQIIAKAKRLLRELSEVKKS